MLRGFQFVCRVWPSSVDKRMQLFDISISIAGIDRIVLVEMQIDLRLTSIGIVVVKPAVQHLVSRRRWEIERKRAIKSSYRALRPQSIHFVDNGRDEMGIQLRKCVGISRTGPEDGHPLSIINDRRSGIERMQK